MKQFAPKQPKREEEPPIRRSANGWGGNFSDDFSAAPHPNKDIQAKYDSWNKSIDTKRAQRIQPKLTIGSPDDKYEQEADQVADSVMSKSRELPPVSATGSRVQSEAEETIQPSFVPGAAQIPVEGHTKPISHNFLQTEMAANAKNASNQVEDTRGAPMTMRQFVQTELKEREAMRRQNTTPHPLANVSRQEVIRRLKEGDDGESEMVNAKLQEGNEAETDAEMVNAKFQFPKLPAKSSTKKPATGDAKVKKAEPGAEPKKEKGDKALDATGKIDAPKPPKPAKSEAKPPKIQKREEELQREEIDPMSGNEAAPEIASASFEVRLKATKSGGQKLPKALRKEMEARFGHSFKAVRIHLSTEAAQLCQEIGARAFAHGSDIYFNTGQFNPDSETGKRLLAHELTHTIQQGANAEQAVQREPFKPTGNEPKTEATPPEIKDGEEVQEAGDGFMEGHDNYDEDNVDKPVSEMDEDEKEQMNATSSESKEEQAEVEESGVNKPKVDRGGDAMKKTTTQQAELEAKDKEKDEKKEGEDKDKEGKKGEMELSPAEEAAARSKEALQRAEELKDPKAFKEFKDPRVEKPVDSEGNALPGDKDVDTLVLGLAYLGRAFREHAFELIKYSVAQGKKAYSIDAVLEKQREDLANSQALTDTADKHSAQYKEGAELGAGAKAESDVREKFTSEKTPGIKAIADDSLSDSKSMADDTGSQAQEHSSNLPKDADARKDAEEQGGDMNDMATGAMTIYEAFVLAIMSLEAYQKDAEFAKEKNVEGQANLDQTNETIAAYDERNQVLKDGNQKTTEQLAAVELAPEDMRTRAASTKDGGYELYAATVVMEVELIDIQENYLKNMATVRSVRQIKEDEKAQQKENDRGFTQDEMMIIAMSGMGETEQQEFVEDLPEGKEADLMKAVDGLESLTGSQEEKDAWVKKDDSLANQLLGQKRERVDLGFNKAVGLEQDDPRQPEFAPIEEERKKRLNKPMDIADQNMTVLSYQEKEMIAGNLVTDTTIDDVQNMFTWENAGNMVKGMVDPRNMISGVFGGFEKIGNGIVNFSEHWKEDPVGAVLKAGADIATGIASIASTVLGVCAAISAVLLAITIFGWMFPSPITVPSMTWLGTVMTVSGYTAIIAGALSFDLNMLMYQRNLHQAASATTAREFLGNALEMKENVADGATGLMAVVEGVGGVKMGPGFDMKNVVGGFKTRKTAFNTMKDAWKGVKGVPAHLAGKGKKLLDNILSGGKDVFKGLRDRIKALFSKKKNKPDAIRNQDVLDGDGTPPVNERTPDVVDEGLDNTPGQQNSGKKTFDDRQKVYDADGNEVIGNRKQSGQQLYNKNGERIMSISEYKAMVKRIQSMRGKNGTQVRVVQDKFGKNMPDGAAAAFDPDTGIIYVRNNPTYLELYHESMHAKQWMQQGGVANYRGNYSSLAREEFVFQEIMNNQRLFTPEEILRSQRVIFKYRNGAWPEDIIGPNWRPDPSDMSFWKGVDPESLPKPTGATTNPVSPMPDNTRPTGMNSKVDGMDAMPLDVDNYMAQFKKVDMEIRQPIEFGGDLMKRDGVDLYVLGRTKGSKIVGGSGSHAGTLNIKDIDGIIVLRQPIPKHIQEKFPKSFYGQTRAYWDEINGPWLDDAINSGADIRFIQDPRAAHNITHVLSEAQKAQDLFKNMISHKTYLHFEYQYLLKRGYVLQENGLMIKLN